MTYEEVYLLDSAEKRFEKTEYLIEATHEEEFGLWRQHHDKMKWVQCHGFWQTIGEVEIRRLGDTGNFKKMPVTVTMNWQLIDGHLVCFYEASSLVVDYGMVEEWIRPKCKQHTNASNFHHFMHYMRDRRAMVTGGTPNE